MPKPMPSVLLTRPAAQSKQFAVQLRQAGCEAEIVKSPLLEIVGTGKTPDPDAFDEVIFTSRNAVDFVRAQPKRAWCVGGKTADKARVAGWSAVSADGNVDDLLNMILQEQPKGRLMHLRGEHSRGQLAKTLVSAGLTALECVIYNQAPLNLKDDAKRLLSGENPVVVPLFSPRSAAFLAAQAPYSAPILCVAISDAAAAELRGLPLAELQVSSVPTAAAMLESTLSLIDAG